MWSQDLYQEVLNYAATVHGDQKVPGRTYSYVVHLTEVAQEIMAAIASGTDDERGFDHNLAIISALLHDAMEDAGVALDELSSRFGPEVAAGVAALSKDPALPDKAAKMADSLERIVQQPREIWMVKMADRITNLQAPPAYWTLEKKQAYRAEAQLIHDALHSASPFLARRLQQKIDSYPAD